MSLRFQHDGAEISLRPATQGDFDWAFDVKCDAMRTHIEAKWAWDEAFQLALHETRWNEKPWFVIALAAAPIGTISLHWLPTHLRIGEFYLRNTHRGRGIGGRLLTKILEQCDAQHREVRLEALRWNPVQNLYARHGFKIVSGNEIHYFMTRRPNKFMF